MDFLNTIFATIIALGVLVSVHEWGHFIVARLCGVKVLTFSVGFGKQLVGRTGKQGTRFVLSAIPLGGYVRMLDEREGPVPSELKSQAFNNKSVFQRFAIVAAGPAVNLIFAVLAYAFIFTSGVTVVRPVVGELIPNSPAAQSGLPNNVEILAINGQNSLSWGDVNTQLTAYIGETTNIILTVQPLNSSLSQQVTIPVNEWQFDIETQSPVSALGVIPWQPEIEPIIGQVVAGERAEQAGLQVGDRLLAIDGEPIADWIGFVTRIQQSPQQRLTLEVEREGMRQSLFITPKQREVSRDGQTVPMGYIGAGVQPYAWPESMQRDINYGVFESIGQAAVKTYDTALMILDSIWKMIEGVISVKNLSGPITIAKVAGASAESGLISFVSFMAYLSISLGVLNLLPIPMLDGGHLMFYLAEMLRGKPLPESIQAGFQRVGMALLFSLMGLAMFNDILRL
ncbi:MAG: RIP metalloprotease RseP [Pontibacterium sp.]